MFPNFAHVLVNKSHRLFTEEDQKFIDDFGDNPGHPDNKIIIAVKPTSVSIQQHESIATGQRYSQPTATQGTGILPSYKTLLPQSVLMGTADEGTKKMMQAEVRLYESEMPHPQNPALPPVYEPMYLMIDKKGYVEIKTSNTAVCWWVLHHPQLINGPFQNKSLAPEFTLYQKHLRTKQQSKSLISKAELIVNISNATAPKRKALAIQVHNDTTTAIPQNSFHNIDNMKDEDIQSELLKLADAFPVELDSILNRPDMSAQELRIRLLDAKLIEESGPKTYFFNEAGKKTVLFNHTPTKSAEESWIIWSNSRDRSAERINELYKRLTTTTVNT